ncbi:hypothetical protein EUGRSUZ_G00265 [Eucalyptus grandis]|uniref:Uncharacterized protein n=2 Tax=Eucalyptus grandis TaxID=71139 RepID=A0ACC3K4H2_EUCGR|nr:hypothetical protein EUGRSUZ_G00265 [Eucalyptus grandis]
MFFKILVLVSLLAVSAYAQVTSFVYNGFTMGELSLYGMAWVTPDGLLTMGYDLLRKVGHAFHPEPVQFKNSPNGSVFSFSTTFIFAIRPQYKRLGGHGIVFMVTPQRGFPGFLPSQYLGMFDSINNGNATNHVLGVEFDTVQDYEFADINDNHVGIDLNGLVSVKSTPAGYYADGGKFNDLNLKSGKPMQVWVDYDGMEKLISVTLAPIKMQKPNTPLLSLTYDLASIFNENMYVGFSSSTGLLTNTHYVLGWSLGVNAKAQELALSQLPKLPQVGKKDTSKVLTIGLPWVVLFLISILISSVIYVMRRKQKFAEVLEDWEREYGPHRFKYKDLYIATKGFREQELLGTGGFGRVYRGILPTSNIEIAVKRVSHESRQGMREFVAEIISIGRLRHRNIVSLLGYCRRKGELLLVYDYMPNGSLDRYLYNQPTVTLNWRQRFRVIKGVASGLLYLHEGWEQVTCGRRPIQNRDAEDTILVDWVFSCWDRGAILEARDPKLGAEFVEEEMELVLKLGLMCSHPEPLMRPSIRQILHYLEGDIPTPELSSIGGRLTVGHHGGCDDLARSPSSMENAFQQSYSVVESLLSGGR